MHLKVNLKSTSELFEVWGREKGLKENWMFWWIKVLKRMEFGEKEEGWNLQGDGGLIK